VGGLTREEAGSPRKMSLKIGGCPPGSWRGKVGEERESATRKVIDLIKGDDLDHHRLYRTLAKGKFPRTAEGSPA